jgi:bifunctional DNA-binding transcriptional regulator/antitoxin component of YhaV-PrlF toxin-antitoxin module
MSDYKKYALGQVENFLYDAMSSGATPQEIYDVIKGVVEDNYYTYKKCASEAYELLGLLNGNGKGHINLDQEHSEHYYHYNRNKPVAKLVVPSDKDGKIAFKCDGNNRTPQCEKSWNDFWEEPNYDDMELMPNLQYTDEEIGAMCDAAEAKDKVSKWILPVESDGPSGEYFITFPDDLLEAANLKEGDQIEWHDQGDGSFKLIKKETQPSWTKGNDLSRVKTYQEMVNDGWSMTDDGFWIKEN